MDAKALETENREETIETGRGIMIILAIPSTTTYSTLLSTPAAVFFLMIMQSLLHKYQVTKCVPIRNVASVVVEITLAQIFHPKIKSLRNHVREFLLPYF